AGMMRLIHGARSTRKTRGVLRMANLLPLRTGNGKSIKATAGCVAAVKVRHALHNRQTMK
ncbi:hypothetical protein ACQ3G7_24685, partial [Kosakonia oryzendophytica]|uniref:hypothetical protein n=1 Tax=Kosakonia oryzendophytica TaxID=1005665 RepID=UPI003D34AE8B